MRRLPPSSAATLPSAFLSFLVHAGVVLAGLMAAPAIQPEPVVTSQMLYIPIDLVTVSDETNMTAVTMQAEPTPVEEMVKEEKGPAEAGLPPPDEDAVSFAEPQQKPKELPKKPEAKPAPPAPPAKSFNSELDDILSSVSKDRPKQQRDSAGTAPASAKEAPRLSAGDRRNMTARVEDIIKSQLVSKGCFADHSDMADARRLRATFRVWFGRNGKFSQPYQLVSPTREPFNDPPLQAFIAHARRALNMCNDLGWQVPEEYFRLPQPQYIDLEFVPKIGANP